MKRALGELRTSPRPGADRRRSQVPELGVRQRPIVKGDALSVSIAAASIVAKVARDAIMRECDARFPGYGLAHNMGYASDDHRDALRRHGPSEIHRRSFNGTQRWLF
jgi:ribonuclease HII